LLGAICKEHTRCFHQVSRLCCEDD
jgi:hypothetical protein